MKDPRTRTMEVGHGGRIGGGRWGMGRAGESNGRKMGTTVIEQQ